MNTKGNLKLSSSAVLWQFFGQALLWLIPAVLVLPVYILVIGISLIISEGVLIGLLAKFKGGINAAIGLLLLLATVASLVFMGVSKLDAEGYGYVAFFALVCGGLSFYLSRRELKRIASALNSGRQP